MTLTSALVNHSIKGLTRIVCRIDDLELKKIPQQGPLILVVNHVNFFDAPMIYTHLYPRPLTGFVKVETWDNPVFKILFDHWKAIPIRRGELDLKAFQSAYKALQDKHIVAVAPEGTRSGDGVLQIGMPGVVLLALKSGAPIMPVAYYGSEIIWKNIRSIRRTRIKIKVGEPFTLDQKTGLKTKEARQKATDEIMFRISRLLPEQYRGYYSNLTEATTDYIHMLPEEDINSGLQNLSGQLPHITNA